MAKEYKDTSEAASRNRALSKARYAKNREAIKMAVRDYRRRNAALVRQRDHERRLSNPSRKAGELAYNVKNRAKRNAYGKKYRLENLSKLYAKNKRWRANNSDWVRSRNQQYRARKRGATIGNVAIVLEWEKRWRAKGFISCFWCKGRFRPSMCHSDHIHPLAKGGKHSIENLCVSCESCNLSKHDRLPHEWSVALKEPALL